MYTVHDVFTRCSAPQMYRERDYGPLDPLRLIGRLLVRAAPAGRKKWPGKPPWAEIRSYNMVVLFIFYIYVLLYVQYQRWIPAYYLTLMRDYGTH